MKYKIPRMSVIENRRMGHITEYLRTSITMRRAEHVARVEKINARGISGKKREEKKLLRDVGLDGRLESQWILKKLCGVGSIGQSQE